MWAWLWLALGVAACARAQSIDTRVSEGDSSSVWGWQQQPLGPTTVGQYYVKLPQSEQLVRYAADNSGYHSAVALNATSHTASFALGQRALELNAQPAPQLVEASPDPNATTKLYQQDNNVQSQTTPPVEIFLLPQQFQTPVDQSELFQVQPSAIPENLIQYSTPYLYFTNDALRTTLYPTNVQNLQNPQNVVRPNPQELDDQDHEVLTASSVVKVFKDHNCTKNERNSDAVAKESVNKARKQNKPKEQNKPASPNYDNDGKRPLSYRGAVHFKVESPRENARSERYYFTTITPPTTKNNKDEGIARLVESTQDLISNEDLLKINNAAEKQQLQIHTEDLIKPRPKFSLRGEQTTYGLFNVPRNRITVKAKFGKVVENDVQHTRNHGNKEQLPQTSRNEYRFISPIIVAEPTIGSFKEQIMNNIVSTMVPYIEDGFEIVSVKNTLDNNDQNRSGEEENDDVTVDVAARPLGQKYLAPITVALRLYNANDTETLNRVYDHETSDSEPVPQRVVRPQKEKTNVEIQESIPVSITHINDVEVHEYLDEGKSNIKSSFNIAQSLFNKYVDALESSKQIQKNMNNRLYKYGSQKNPNTNEDNLRGESDTKEHLEPSENRHSNTLVSPNDDAKISELLHFYGNPDNDNQQLIQPIIIEKEVPITKFVDRFIEKQVPYPEPVEIYKTVSVDRPVLFPVPYEKIVEKPVEVTKYVDKPYPVEYHHAYPVEVKVPYPVEQKVYIDRPIHVPYPVEKVVEKQIVQQVPVPTPVAVPFEVQVPVEQRVLYPVPIETPVPFPVEIEKPVEVEKIVHREVPVPYAVEKRVPYPVPYETKVPVPYPVEKRVPVTVEKIVEKPVTKVVEKPVHIQVPVPQPVPVAVRVPEPYPVERVVEKKVPYPVHIDRVVEKKIPVKVPYPVQTVVEKIVEKPVLVTKYIDKPYPVEKRVPYPVEKIVEKKVPYPVKVPVEVKVPYPVERIVEKPVHIPIKVPYPVGKPFSIYSYGYQGAQQLAPQYSKFMLDQQRQPSIQRQVQQQLLPNNRKERPKSVQTTQWGNQYASNFQYVNSTQQANDFKRSLVDYLSQMNRETQGYYGPPPMQKYEGWWEKNKDYVVEMKVRRTDRTPKVTKLRIEYGGFKPPLVPSTEVDLDGIPVHKEGES